MIAVRFFASLREELGMDQYEVELESTTVRELITHLSQVLETDLLLNDNTLVSVNHHLVESNQPVRAGDEVAFFPPVTGG